MGGKFSGDMKNHNMVYQRTRLGPPVWNIGYADAALTVKLHGFLEVVFADDLNCFKDFGLFTPNCMRKCSNAMANYTNQGRRTKLASTQRPNLAHLGYTWKHTIGYWEFCSTTMQTAKCEIVSEASWNSYLHFVFTDSINLLICMTANHFVF